MKVVKDHKGNEFKNMKELCKAYDISYQTYMSRIRIGWTLEKALTTKKRKKKER